MSAALAKAETLARPCIKVAICAPKGGVGKTTLARALLVAAHAAGVNAVGVNVDEQTTLTAWGAARDRRRTKRPEVTQIDVLTHSINDWRHALKATSGYSIAFIDTPPGHGQNAVAIRNLCDAADLVLIPTGVSEDDLAEVIPFAKQIVAGKAAFVLMKVNRRFRSFQKAQRDLMKIARLCPAEVPALEEIHIYHKGGLTALDVKQSAGADQLISVWNFVRHEVHL